MAKLPGLFQRDGIYQIRVVIPQHLQATFGGRTKIIQSLSTTNRRDASILGAMHRAKLLTQFSGDRHVWHESTRSVELPKISSLLLEPVPRSSTRSTEVLQIFSSTQITKQIRLRDAYDRWKCSKPRSLDSLNACSRSIDLYEGFTGNPPLSQLTREQGDGFRAWLQKPERKTTCKTARDRLTWVKSVLKYASRDLGLIDRNPWEGIDIAFKTTNKRRPWTDAELKTFFSQDLHIAYKLPKLKRAGADAAYWIPLLGLYTGARIGELAQLRLSDVESDGHIDQLSITDEGEGQSVKSQAGVRKVPVHSELVRLGFLDYVKTMRDQGHALLWPKLVTRGIKPGDYFGRWFGVYRKALGFGLYPDFHCMRHTVRSQMAEAEVYFAGSQLVLNAQAKILDALNLKIEAEKATASAANMKEGATTDAIKESAQVQSENSRIIQEKLADKNMVMDAGAKAKIGEGYASLATGAVAYIVFIKDAKNFKPTGHWNFGLE